MLGEHIQTYSKLPIRNSLRKAAFTPYIHVDGYKFEAVFYSRIQVDTCSRDNNFVADTGYM